MQSVWRQAMGNCVSCRESSQQVETQVTEIPEPTPVQEVVNSSLSVGRSVQHRHSLTVMDNISNGNIKSAPNIESPGSLQRERSLRVFRMQPGARHEPKQKELSDAKIQTLFDNYKDANEPNHILAEGIETLLNDLNLSPDEFKVLVLAWRLNAEHMCQFSREEFINGLKALKADSILSINVKLNDVTEQVLNDSEIFKDLYRFTFRFGLEKCAGQRVLPTEMACCLWRIVFSLRPSALLDRWLDYLSQNPGCGVPRDTWDMYLYLTDQVGADLSLYDDSHAWPSIFDDFIEYENDRTNQNVAKCREQPIIEDCT